MASADDHSVLDALFAQCDWSRRDTAIFDTSPAAVLAAARAVTLGELPGLFDQRQSSETDVTVVEDLLAQGFVIQRGFESSAGSPALVLTRVARFWQTRQEVRSSTIDAAGFAAFAEPGFARAALSLTATAVAQGVLVVADVRLAVTDALTRRELNRYWLVETWANAHNQRNFLRAIQARVLEIA